MIPLPTSKVFRSRGGALWWSFWVIVAAVLTVGFGSAPGSDAGDQPNSADVAALQTILNAQQ